MISKYTISPKPYTILALLTDGRTLPVLSNGQQTTYTTKGAAMRKCRELNKRLRVKVTFEGEDVFKWMKK